MARLDDGHQTLIEFSSNPNIKFYEKEVTPPSMEGGGENDTTTMRNNTVRTKSPKKLKGLGEASLVVAYDTAVLEEVWTLLNTNDQIKITFPDGSTYEFWGWLDNFEPGALVEGEQPTADVTIILSNQDSSGDESEPVYTAAS